MYKPSEELRPRRLAALTGVTLVAVVGLLLQLPLGASAGLAPGEIQRQTGEAAARPVPPGPAAAPKAAPGAYRLRCWQFGRLIFDEGPVSLAADARRRGMKVVLDGVFNHMGRQAPVYREAAADPTSPKRDWFFFGDEYPGGSRSWLRAQNLPELNLENPAVREHLYAAHDSVVRSYLRDGVDGWRLDVAYDIGFEYLHQLTQAAHAQKPGSLVVGEIWSYPKEWMPALDAVMTLTAGTGVAIVDAAPADPDDPIERIKRIAADSAIAVHGT